MLAVLMLGAPRAMGGEPTSPETPVEPEQPAVVSDDLVVEPDVDGRAADAAAAAALRLDYALARVKLAELDLERAIAANTAVRGAVGDREIERLRNHVVLLHRQLEIAREQPRTASRQATLAAAEVARDNIRADLDAAVNANHLVPGAVSDLNVRRLRARLEMAEIRVALCRNPASGLSLLDEMQWNIDLLTDQLIDVRHQVETRGTGDFGKPN
ncbi:MAG: hypothetical protein ACKO1M_00325 [Planctomycetota bacterium]